MSPPVCRICLAAALAAAAASAARADIYTWTDTRGVVNVSNLPPPDDAKVTSVLRSTPRDAAREAVARDAARQAELLALNDKLRQLQSEMDAARRDPPPVAYAPPPVVYAPAPAPATYIVNVLQAPPPSYASGYGCDSSFADCGVGIWPGFGYYGTAFIATGRGRNFRHSGAANPGNRQLIPPLIPLPHVSRGGPQHRRPG